MAQFARKIVLSGAVQGCGVRPALARLAARQGWSGSVRNSPHGVELIVQGQLPEDDELRSLISCSIPTEASVEHFALEHDGGRIAPGFRIEDSDDSGPLTARIPLDRAICQQCLQEVQHRGNRRFQYPFTTCAACGPRFSILHSMPFDRERTAMRAFEMCEDCRREYEDSNDRRFHAQTLSCPHCGPRLWISDGRRTIDQPDQTPWEIAVEGLRVGRIVALKGLGGYQLLADATSSAAVRRLRQRKRRMAKPFAVLCQNMAAARRLASLDAVSSKQLRSAVNPIVLVPQHLSTDIAAEVNPGLKEIGLLLPTTALHDVLVSAVKRPLVCTSGNLDGNPLVRDCGEAERELSGIADLFLHHDREIVHPVDDSVVRVIARRPVTLRAARGMTPLPLSIPKPAASAIHQSACVACGGQQKSSIAWHARGQAVLGPHVGDLETVASQERWDERRQMLPRLTHPDFEREVPAVICDPHPGYAATQWGAAYSDSPHFVWHHHAHAVTGMLEHGWLNREVLGVTWDGTGLGPDGTIWGGEFLRATATSFRRVAYLRPFHLPGGETAISNIRRLAFAVLSQVKEIDGEDLARLLQLSPHEIENLSAMLTPEFSPLTTSCGRLFDAAACLILGQTKSEFKGHAAMALEAECDRSAPGAYEFRIAQEHPTPIDWRPVFRAIVSDREVNASRGIMAMKFHRGLAQVISRVSERFPELPVLLGGGVFQNRVLVELVAENWPSGAPPLGLPGVLPPNDGGLAAGQLAVMMMSNDSQESADVSRSPRSTGSLDQSRSDHGGRGH
ncbi:MAG: carbamoyltransferase HypF [Planctomycetaceae bacterium]